MHLFAETLTTFELDCLCSASTSSVAELGVFGVLDVHFLNLGFLCWHCSLTLTSEGDVVDEETGSS